MRVKLTVPHFVIETEGGAFMIWADGRTINFSVREIAEQFVGSPLTPPTCKVRDLGKVEVEIDVNQIPVIGCESCAFVAPGRFGRIAEYCPACLARAVGAYMTDDLNPAGR